MKVRIESVAHGGDGVARVDGKVMFVPGVMPSELVEVEVVRRGASFDRGRLVSILEPSSERISPPCRHFGECGGCDWQFAAYEAQLRWKTSTVRSQLEHIGGIVAEVRPCREVGPRYGYRNRMDFEVVEGRLALTRPGRGGRLPLEMCLLGASPIPEAVAEPVPFRGRVTLRVGIRTGEAVAVVSPPPRGEVEWRLPVLGPDEAVIHEEVAGHRFRIHGRAFFQVNTWGAEHLVDTVREAAEMSPGMRMLDGYAGVGLFSATVGRDAEQVVAVESDPVAVRDLLANTQADVVEADMAVALRRLQDSFDIAVVDPPRQGLGRDVTALLGRSGCEVLVSVSCDPASFARDAAWLVAEGYQLEWVQPLDLFPQTHHVETVARFTRR
ncbi:MAG: 23S rRNA (uracil-5-)-methyltransferase RumA [Acidimicrobiia bacterium]|nr:MAG: 23S rRNA (uracil-5-)-methyltransferase RumA [Acidimicrobiia bacterium]